MPKVCWWRRFICLQIPYETCFEHERVIKILICLHTNLNQSSFILLFTNFGIRNKKFLQAIKSTCIADFASSLFVYVVCESSTAASLWSNICHLFALKCWKKVCFFVFMFAYWPRNSWTEFPMYYGVATLNIKTF